MLPLIICWAIEANSAVSSMMPPRSNISSLSLVVNSTSGDILDRQQRNRASKLRGIAIVNENPQGQSESSDEKGSHPSEQPTAGKGDTLKSPMLTVSFYVVT